MLINSTDRRHPRLTPDLGNTFIFFTTENDMSCGFVILHGLYYVGVGSLYAHFLESFYHKWVFNLVESFLCIY